MIKVGRNDPCPCGSGKKYKKCHLDNQLAGGDNLPGLLKSLERLKSVDLIAQLSALQLLPQNHGYLLRLEFISTVAASLTQSGTESVSADKLVSIIETAYPQSGEIGGMEDPPEELFTENIIFHGGDYVVYPGIKEHGAYILQNLLGAIFQSPNNINKALKNKIQACSIAILSLSHRIAERIGHVRYMAPEEGAQDHIVYPERLENEKYCSAVTFTKLEIAEILSDWGLDESTLVPFCAELGDHPIPSHYTECGLFQQPIVKCNDLYIVALPGSIVGALRHFIWSLAISSGDQKELASSLNRYTLRKIRQNFRLMSYTELPESFPDSAKAGELTELVYEIDIDKLVYVQILTDNAVDYDPNNPYGHWDNRGLCRKAEIRQTEIINGMFANRLDITGILCILIVAGMGRSFQIPMEEPSPNTYQLIISAADLDVVTRLREADSLTLWKYAIADHELKERSLFPVLTFSFLDRYSLYLDHDQSFYVSDDQRFSFINIGVGYGRTLRARAAKLWDTHLAEIGNPPTLTAVTKRYESDEIPIYVLEENIGLNIDHLIEGYEQALWVKSSIPNKKIPSNDRGMHFQVASMFAYWCWQLPSHLKPFLRTLGSDPIHISFEVENIDQWTVNLREDATSIDSPKYRFRVDSRTIHFTLCDALRPLFNRADNEGERIILKGLLLAVSDLLEIHSGSTSLLKLEIDNIINSVAPISTKKIMMLLDPSRMTSLDARFLPRKRAIQEHDVQQILDGLLTEIKYDGPVGIISNHSDRVQICNQVVGALRQKIKNLLSELDGEYLLRQLVAQNEALLHAKRSQKINIPTSIACFGDISSTLTEIANTARKNDTTSMGIRALIEMIAAEPPAGDIKCSTSDLDSLIAHSYLLIDWAITSDQLHLKIFDHEVSILQSGRIGRSLHYIKEVWDPFYRAKTQEWNEDAIERFGDHFESPKSASMDSLIDRFEIAFEAELGSSLTEILEFCHALSMLSYEQGTSSASMRRSKLLAVLSKRLEFSSDKVESLISMFCLEPRDDWEIAPKGFNEAIDIWP